MQVGSVLSHNSPNHLRANSHITRQFEPSLHLTPIPSHSRCNNDRPYLVGEFQRCPFPIMWILENEGEALSSEFAGPSHPILCPPPWRDIPMANYFYLASQINEYGFARENAIFLAALSPNVCILHATITYPSIADMRPSCHAPVLSPR